MATGPERAIAWGVPDGTRDVKTGQPVFDDLLISASLCWVLDQQQWGTAESHVVAAQDPLLGMEDVYLAAALSLRALPPLRPAPAVPVVVNEREKKNAAHAGIAERRY